MKICSTDKAKEQGLEDTIEALMIEKRSIEETLEKERQERSLAIYRFPYRQSFAFKALQRCEH